MTEAAVAHLLSSPAGSSISGAAVAMAAMKPNVIKPRCMSLASTRLDEVDISVGRAFRNYGVEERREVSRLVKDARENAGFLCKYVKIGSGSGEVMLEDA